MSFTPLPRSAPEAQGIASRALLDLLVALEARAPGLHSLMLLRGSAVVAEGWWAPYAPTEPHMLFSLSKSFTATAAGLAFAEGLLSPDDPVTSFFPDEVPAVVGPNLAAMRVRHLLSMSTGHDEDTLTHLVRAQEGDWVRTFLARPVAREPGTFFLYNSGATYLVSAILQRLTGQTVRDWLEPRLFAPLGIATPYWERCPHGINTGGWGLNLRTEDIARFGLLYARDGEWRGRRLLPAGWVAEATRAHVSNGDDPDSDWAQGYGYQFWRCRHNLYRGDGAFGQFCVVLPDHDTLVAITAGLGDMQGVLNVLWEHLLPALGDAPLPADAEGEQALRTRLASLVLPAPAGAPESPLAARVSGRTYDLAPNDQQLTHVTFDFAARRLSLTGAAGEQQLAWGSNGTWPRGELAWESATPERVAASGAWTADDTFALGLCWYRTPFCPRLTCRFAGDEVALDYRLNVSFGPLERPTIVGRLTDGATGG